jgi:Glyoxalase/Bleomycin resistance protein/Dioxygenase superfamily
MSSKGSHRYLCGKTLLALFRYGIGEAAFEGDQLAPVDAEVANYASPPHPVRPIDGFGPAYQHFLRIAAAQCAGPAERAMIDHCNRAPSTPDAPRRRLRGSTGANDNEVVDAHGLPLAPPARRRKTMSGIHRVTAIAGNALRNFDFYTRTLGLRLVKKGSISMPRARLRARGMEIGHRGDLQQRESIQFFQT